MRLCKDWPSNEPNAMQFLGTFFFSGDETLQLLLAVFSCQITYGLFCFLSNFINFEPVKENKSNFFLCQQEMTMYLTVLMKIYQKVSSYLLQRSRITLSYRNPHAKKRIVSNSSVVV